MLIKEDKTHKQSVKDEISRTNLSYFSDEANNEFKKSVSKYLDTLDEESRKIAGLHGSQYVSDNDVNRATKFLFTYIPPQPPNRIKDFLIMGGYTVMGVWLTIVVELVFNQLATTQITGIGSSLLLAIGIIMLYFGFKME